MPLAASERRSAPAVIWWQLVRPAAAHQSSSPPRPGKRCIGVLRVREDGDTQICTAKKVDVTPEVCVGGGVAALLFTYSASHYLWLRPLDQVLTNRSGPRGAAPAGLSYT